MDWTAIGGSFTIAGALIALGIYLHQYWHRTIEAEVADPAYRARLIDRHDCTVAAGYYLSLDRLLGWADRVYGPPLGARAFFLSLVLAYVYPLLAALIGWVVANQTAPGGLELFRDMPGWGERLGRAALMVGALGLGFVGVIRADRLSKNLGDRIGKRLDAVTHRPGFLSKAGRWVPELVEQIAGAFVSAGFFAGFFAFVSAGVFAGADAGADAGSFSVVLAGAVVLAVVLAFAGAGAGAGAFVSAGAFAFAIIAVLVNDVHAAALLAFFHLLLPLANAGADWLSLAITRALLRDMANRRPGTWGLAAHLGLDLIAGVLCLGLLLAGLVGVLELWAMIHPASLPFDWRGYWMAARADPIQGIALWVMAFTTLVPTLVHAAFSLTIWQAQKSDYTRQAVALMRGMGSEVSEAARIHTARLILRGRLSGFLRGLFYWGLPLAAFIWVALRLIQS